MWMIVRDLDPEATGWQPFPSNPELRNGLVEALRRETFLRHLAEHRVRATATHLRRSVNPEDLTILTDAVLKYFPTAMVFYRNLVIGIVQSGVDYRRSPKHMNSWWDLHLCFLVSRGARIDRVPTILVTNEQKIRTAAVESGHADFLMSLPEYELLLKSDGVGALAGKLASWD